MADLRHVYVVEVCLNDGRWAALAPHTELRLARAALRAWRSKGKEKFRIVKYTPPETP